jgi:hypothetical protein
MRPSGRIPVATWYSSGEHVVIGPVHDRDVDIRSGQRTRRPNPAEPAANDDHPVTFVAHEDSISGRDFPFAALGGTSPIPASSGQTIRHASTAAGPGPQLRHPRHRAGPDA